MSKNATTTNIEVFTLAEAATYANVSTKTIERYAILHSWPTMSDNRKGRKVKVYRKVDLDKYFKSSDNVEHKSDNVSDKEAKTIENKQEKPFDTVGHLTEDIKFLRSELTVKNEQISKLQNENSMLIESESRTKMLLADLQVKVKALNPVEPVKAMGKKNTWVWWVAFFLLIGALGVGGWLSYDYLKGLIQGLF